MVVGAEHSSTCNDSDIVGGCVVSLSTAYELSCGAEGSEPAVDPGFTAGG